MSGKPSHDRARYWQGIMKDWEISGLAQREFCEKSGVKHATFTYWRGELKKRMGKSSMKGGFLEVKGGFSAVSCDAQIQLYLPNGVKIMISGPSSRELLSEVLANASKISC